MKASDTSLNSTSVNSYIRNLVWHELGLLTLLIMEISILIPWYRAHIADRDTNAATIFLTLFGFALLVMYISRYMRANEILSSFHWIGMMFVLLLGLYGFLKGVVYAGLGLNLSQILSRTISSFAGEIGGIPLSILVIISSLYLWWRGISAAGMGILEFIGTRRRFRYGIISFAVFGVLHNVQENFYLIDVLPIFFISGLIAINLGKTYWLSRRKAAFQLPFTGRWFLGMTIITLIIIVGGLLGAAFLQTDVATEIAEFIVGIFIRGFQALVVLISPLFLWVLPFAEKILKYLESQEVGFTPEEFGEGFIIEGQTSFEIGDGQLDIPNEVIIGFVIILILVLIFIIIRSGRRRMRSKISQFGDEGESTFDPKSLQRGLRKLLEQAQDGLDSLRKFGLGRKMLAATVIRRVYAQFLDWAEELGRPRESWETPFEFQRQISMMFPDETDQIALITKAYNQVRYGEFPEDQEIVAKVKEAWEAIRFAAR